MKINGFIRVGFTLMGALLPVARPFRARGVFLDLRYGLVLEANVMKKL
jgi:hypothetical protein